jgi:hypothetical protein
MFAGLWREETGEAIKIALDGSILDGQYRLSAIIKSGISLRFLLITGLEKDIFHVLDSGFKRTPEDVLHIAGVVNAKNIAAGVRKYFRLKSGGVALTNVHNEKLSNSEILSLYSVRNEFWDAAANMSETWYNKSQRILTTSEYMGMYAFLYDIDDIDSFTFMDSLSDGVGLELTNPIKQLRERLIFSKINTKFTMTNIHRTALIYKAWNLFRSGESVKYIRFNPEIDNFPIPK